MYLVDSMGNGSLCINLSPVYCVGEILHHLLHSIRAREYNKSKAPKWRERELSLFVCCARLDSMRLLFRNLSHTCTYIPHTHTHTTYFVLAYDKGKEFHTKHTNSYHLHRWLRARFSRCKVWIHIPGAICDRILFDLNLHNSTILPKIAPQSLCKKFYTDTTHKLGCALIGNYNTVRFLKICAIIDTHKPPVQVARLLTILCFPA